MNYSINDINTRLFRRGYRRGRRQSGVDGGYAFFHPARVKNEKKKKLQKLGYGDREDCEKGGYWDGVRNDVLGLENWREYAEFGPHGHSLGFPEWLDGHEGEDFILKKYTELWDAESVVNHTRYLMTHRGMLAGEGTLRAIRPWGELHHASDGWAGAETELAADEYEALCAEIAALMGAEWSLDEGLYYPDESAECPECGRPKREFIDLWDLPRLASTKNQGGAEWINRLSDTQREFFRELIEILHHENAPRIYRGDIVHPDDVAAWIDDDRPPPV